MTRPLLFLAGLVGAAGVALGAVAAHLAGGDALGRAALMCMIHAAALLSLALQARSSRLLHIAGIGLAAGTSLFTADMAMRAFTGNALFHYAAPLGGSTMIASWLLIALAALPRPPQS